MPLLPPTFPVAGLMGTLRKAMAGGCLLWSGCYQSLPEWCPCQSSARGALPEDSYICTPCLPLAPIDSLQPDLQWQKPLEKQRGWGEENRVLCNVYQLSSLKSCSQVSRRRLKWQGGGCSDRYPGGALMVTDNLLCRGLIEPDGLINESQVLQAKGRGSGC